jgi:uncharacterized membrane protein HdeD (DUF308 family)
MTTAARPARREPPRVSATNRRIPAQAVKARKAKAHKIGRAWDEFRNWSTLAFWGLIFGYWTFTSHKVLFPVIILLIIAGIAYGFRRASRH